MSPPSHHLPGNAAVVKIIREMQVIIMTSVTTLLANFKMKNAGGTSSRGCFSPFSLRDDTLNEIHFFMSSNPSKVAIKNAKVEISGCITTSVNQFSRSFFTRGNTDRVFQVRPTHAESKSCAVSGEVLFQNEFIICFSLFDNCSNSILLPIQYRKKKEVRYCRTSLRLYLLINQTWRTKNGNRLRHRCAQ